MFCLVGLAVLDEFHITDKRMGVVSIDGYHAVEFFVRKVEVDSGEHLAELFGSHFLVVMAVPVLEEGLEVESKSESYRVEMQKSRKRQSRWFTWILCSSVLS